MIEHLPGQSGGRDGFEDLFPVIKEGMAAHFALAVGGRLGEHCGCEK